MKLSDITCVYFVGIGGIGMSAIARYFAKKGCVVHGYDKTRTLLCEQLEAEGMKISYADEVSTIDEVFKHTIENILVVYTPAIPKDSAILNFFIQHDFKLKKRSEVLGIISEDTYCIAIAGTHGKTTTSALVAHILTHSGYGCNAFLGGILTNYNSNYLFHSNNVMVVEADEYDRSFLTLSPDVAVITSMDADHLDIYGNAETLVDTFQAFSKRLKSGGILFKRAGLPIKEGVEFAFEGPATCRAENIHAGEGAFTFDYLDAQHKIERIKLKLPGNHNVENAVAAIAVAVHLGIELEKIKAAIEDFKGVKRRFQILTEGAHILIDDYAHHPEELKACISAVRMLYPEKKLTAAFQPHLFTRTRDFAEGFAKELSQVDHLLLLDIYPARELPIEGVDASMLLEKMGSIEKEICSLEKLEDRIQELMPELLLIVGAGNIDAKVEPLKRILSNA